MPYFYLFARIWKSFADRQIFVLHRVRPIESLLYQQYDTKIKSILILKKISWELFRSPMNKKNKQILITFEWNTFSNYSYRSIEHQIRWEFKRIIKILFCHKMHVSGIYRCLGSPFDNIKHNKKERATKWESSKSFWYKYMCVPRQTEITYSFKKEVEIFLMFQNLYFMYSKTWKVSPSVVISHPSSYLWITYFLVSSIEASIEI